MKAVTTQTALCKREVMLHPFYSRINSAVGRGLKWSLQRTQEEEWRTQHRHRVPRSSCDHKTTAAFFHFKSLLNRDFFFFCQLRVEVNPWLALLNSISQGGEYTRLILSYFSCSGACLIFCLGRYFFPVFWGCNKSQVRVCCKPVCQP